MATYQTKTALPTKHHFLSTDPDPVKVEGFCTDTNGVDCVRLKQVGRLGLQHGNVAIAMSWTEFE